MSMFPPHRLGGTIECSPGSAGATPIVPGNGSNGSSTSSRKATRPSSIVEIRSHGSGNSSASRPKPGMIAVQPQSRGRSARISTSSTSPGAAPLTNTGPVTGFTRVKSSAATSATEEPRASCPPDASVTSSSTVSPDSISSVGAIELSQTVCVRSECTECDPIPAAQATPFKGFADK